MSSKICIQTKKNDSLVWPYILDELRNEYCLYQQSIDSTDREDQVIKKFLLSEKIGEVLSFLEATEIPVLAKDIEDLAQILNELTSLGVPPEKEDNITVKLEDDETLNFEDTDEDYLDFTRRIEMTKEDLKKINIIQDYHTKKAAFEGLMTRKLGLQEAIELKDRLNDLSSDFYVNEIKILEDNIRPCEIWCDKMEDFLRIYEKYVVGDELKIESSQRGEILRGIKVLKDKMNILILKDPGLENKFVVFNWMFQAKLFVQGEPQSDVKYWKDWLKKAEEGKRKEILESERYKELCKEVKIYQSLIAQVKRIEGQARLLLQPGNQRKDLKDLETIESLLKRLMKCNILSSKEEVYLQNIVDRASKAVIEYKIMRESYTRIPWKKFKQIAKCLEELPVKFPQEIEEQIMKEARINELLKVKQEAAAELRFDIAKKISDEYEGCFVDISEAQTISGAYNQIAEIPKTIENGSKSRGTLSFEALCRLDEVVGNSPLELGSKRSGILKAKIWQAKVDLISFFKENVEIVPKKPIHLQEIYKCLNEGYTYLDHIHGNKDILAACQTSIHFLEDLVRDIDTFFTKISQMQDPRKERCSYSRFIDMEEKIEELKIASVQRTVDKLPSLLQKRQEPSPLIETAASSLGMESEGETSSNDGVLMKKVRTENGFFGIEQIVSQEAVSQGAEEEKVDLMAREDTIGKVLELVEVLKNPQEVFKELENQMVKECQWNKGNSHEKVETVCDSLKKLRENIFLIEELFKQKLADEELEKGFEKNIEDLCVEPEEEIKEQLLQSQIQSNEELRIHPQIQPANPLELDRNKEMMKSNEKEKDPEFLTKQFALEIENNQNCDLPLKDENVPFKHLYNHPLYRRPKQRYSRFYYPPKLRYSPENLPNNYSLNPPTDSMESSDLNPKNSSIQNLNSPQSVNYLEDRNKNDKIDADWENFMMRFSQPSEADDCEITHLRQTKENLNEPSEKEDKEFQASNVNEANNPFGKSDNIIKQIFRGKIIQQTKEAISELSGSLYTYANSDHVSQFPKISIPELKFHQDFLHKFCINLNRLKNHQKSQFQKVFIGWASVETSNPHVLTWTEKNEIGKCSEVPGVEIYLMPVSSDYGAFERLKSELNWTYHENKSSSAPQQYLLFAICLTTKSSHTSLKSPNLISNEENLMKLNQQTNIQNDQMSGIFKGPEVLYEKLLEQFLEQESQRTSEASEMSLDTEVIKAFEPFEQRSEKIEIKIREKSHRQRKAPVLFEPGWKMENTCKGKRVRGENGEKKKRGRSFKQNPSVSIPKDFGLKLLMKMEE